MTEEVLEELKVEPVEEKLRRQKLNWLRHVTRMVSSRAEKNSAELLTEWRKTIWKVFEDTIRQGPHPLLVPWSRKGRAIPLLPLWAVRPVQSLSACTRVHFTFTLQ